MSVSVLENPVLEWLSVQTIIPVMNTSAAMAPTNQTDTASRVNGVKAFLFNDEDSPIAMG